MRHMAGLDDMVPGRKVQGSTAAGTRLWRIVISPKGSIAQDPAIGWGLPSKLGTKATTASLKAEAAIGRDELRKDPDVRDVSVTIESEGDGRYRVRVVATLVSGVVDLNETIEAQS